MKIEREIVSDFAVIFIIALLILSSVALVIDSPFPNNSGGNINKFEQESNEEFSEREPIVPPRENITVVSAQAGQLYAFAPDGRLLYYNDTADSYWDVDPSKEGKRTVMVVTTTNLDESTALNQIQRINLTSGKTETLYSQTVPRYGTYKWHDVDRIGSEMFAVADMAYDSAFIVNISSGEKLYEWFAYENYPLESGGEYPKDWTHINDIELTEYGLMLSLRNHDSVVFVERNEGMVEDMTLGEDGNHSVLYEQHNPDYIPKERGGPAIIVADSQNNRIVEYQYMDEQWKQTWKWRDAEMAWPRDADRLPNGHTLIADSNSNRIIEVNRSGSIVWEINNIPNYEVERLGTGDESLGGSSAKDMGLQRDSSYQRDKESAASILSIKQQIDAFSESLLRILPNKIVNAIRFSVPSWMGPTGIVSSGLGIICSCTLTILWFKRSDYTVQSPIKNK